MGRRHRGDIECVRETLTEAELSLYQFLRSITDSRRLKEMLPSWCRPKPIPRNAQFVPGLPPRYPYLPTGQQWYAAHSHQFGCKHDRAFPGRADVEAGGAEYIKAFDSLNGLKPCPIEWVKVQSFG